jgi:hypothetical protein
VARQRRQTPSRARLVSENFAGHWDTDYFTMRGANMILSAAIVPLVILTLKGRFADPNCVARGSLTLRA